MCSVFFISAKVQSSLPLKVSQQSFGWVVDCLKYGNFMADFIFKISPNITLGSYTATRLGQFCREWGSKFIVIIDPVLKDAGVSEKILQSLDSRNLDFFVFSEISEGASTKAIQQALALAKDAHVHGVIAVGGSKALQVGRAVSAYYYEIQDLYSFVDGSLPSSASLPLICVPTTPRAPFVFTNFIPVTDSRTMSIKLLKIQNGLCKLVLFDPNLTVTLTENQITAMSIEILCLAIEAYLSPKSNFFSDMVIEKGIELLSFALDGNPSLSTTPADVLLSQGGCLASLGSSCSSLGAASLLSLCINSRFRISRSLTSAILLPYIIEDAGHFKTDKIVKLARIFRTASTSDAPENIVAAFSDNIRQRIAKTNLPPRLKDLSFSVEQLSLAAEDAGELDLITSLQRSMTSDDLFDLIKLAY